MRVDGLRCWQSQTIRKDKMGQEPPQSHFCGRLYRFSNSVAAPALGRRGFPQESNKRAQTGACQWRIAQKWIRFPGLSVKLDGGGRRVKWLEEGA